jgi:nitroreductase
MDTAIVEIPVPSDAVGSAGVEFADVVRRRRMVHVFEQRPVDPAVIDHLLDIARRGPSAGFSQGTDFLVLDDKAAVARFWALTDDPQFPRCHDELAVAPPVVAWRSPIRLDTSPATANPTRSPSASSAPTPGR